MAVRGSPDCGYTSYLLWLYLLWLYLLWRALEEEDVPDAQHGLDG